MMRALTRRYFTKKTYINLKLEKMIGSDLNKHYNQQGILLKKAGLGEIRNIFQKDTVPTVVICERKQIIELMIFICLQRKIFGWRYGLKKIRWNLNAKF